MMVLCFWFDTWHRHDAKRHEFPRVGACWWTPMGARNGSSARTESDQAREKALEFRCLVTSMHERDTLQFVLACDHLLKTQGIQSVLANLVDSGVDLESILDPKGDSQQAPTRENLKGFRHVMQ